MEQAAQWIQAFGRYLLPIVTLLFLLRSLASLLVNRPRPKTMGVLVNSANGDRFPLNHWETSIGRSASCDITMGYGSISRFHAVLSRRKDGWFVTDTGSQGGVYVNDEKVKNIHRIYDGDSLAVGSIVLYFVAPDAQRPGGRVKRGNAAFYPKPANELFQKPKDREATPALVPVDGQPFYLGKTPCVIGSSPDCDLCLNTPAIAPQHAKLSPIADGWVIADLGSSAGTFVDNQPVTRSQLLFNEDTIQLGDVTLIYYDDYRTDLFQPHFNFDL